MIELLTAKYNDVEIIISINVIANINIWKPNLSMSPPHINLDAPLTIPNRIPR